MKKNWMAVLEVILLFLAAVLFTVTWLMDRQEKSEGTTLIANYLEKQPPSKPHEEAVSSQIDCYNPPGRNDQGGQ